MFKGSLRRYDRSPSHETLDRFVERHDDDDNQQDRITIPRCREARMACGLAGSQTRSRFSKWNASPNTGFSAV
jgi:hypothetical protein